MIPSMSASRVQNVEGAQRLQHFSRTKMCKFQILGMCAKGPDCAFAHSQRELRPLPDLTCTKLCKTLIETGYCTNESCTFAHNREELRTTSTYHKTKLCRFSLAGHCALGSRCNFAHSEAELRAEDELSAPPARAAPLVHEGPAYVRHTASLFGAMPGEVPDRAAYTTGDPAYVTLQHPAAPLRLVRSAGGGLADLGRERSLGLREVRSASGRLADLGVEEAALRTAQSGDFSSDWGDQADDAASSASTSASTTPRATLAIEQRGGAWQVMNTFHSVSSLPKQVSNAEEVA